MQVRAILFDVDDTLFDYTGSDRAGFLAHVAAEGLLGAFTSPDSALAAWRSVMAAEYARFVAGAVTFEEHRRRRARAFVAAARPAAPPLEDDSADAWFARYHAHFRAAWRAFPDAAPTLAALAERSLPVGVVSNSTAASQREKLHRIGLAEHVRDGPLVCSADHGAAKPDPSIFRAACAELGLPPETVAYVGDKRDVDAEGACAAGLAGVWLDRAAGAAGPVGAVGTDVPGSPGRGAAGSGRTAPGDGGGDAGDRGTGRAAGAARTVHVVQTLTEVLDLARA